MKNRIISVAVLLLMILPLAVSCVQSNDEPETTEAASTATEAAVTDVVETEYVYETDDLGTMNFNETITLLIWKDHSMKEFYSEGLMGDDIDTSIYQRNDAVESRLGVQLAYREILGNSDHMTDYIQTVKNDADANAVVDYDIYAGYSRVAPALSTGGYNENLLAHSEYLNFEKPWWPYSLIKESTIGNQLYFCSGDISTNLLWMMIGTFFNKELLDDYQIAYPYDNVSNNTWTMETLKNITEDIYTDLDATESKTTGDLYGLTMIDVNIDAFGTAGGFTSIEHDAAGKLKISDEFFGTTMVECMQMVNAWFNNAAGFYHHKTTSTARNIFLNGNSLFTLDRLFIAAGKDNSENSAKIDFAFGIVPNPKYSTQQDNYRTNVGHPFTTYAISSRTAKKDACAATLECLASESYRRVTPAVFYTAMKLKYSTDPVASEMYDLIRDNVSFDLGRVMSDSFKNYTSNLFRTTVLGSTFSVATYKTVKKLIQAGVDDVNKAFGLGD